MKNSTILLILTVLFFLIIVSDYFPQQIDKSFGQHGIVTTPFNVIGNSIITSSALQRNGKIVVAGASGIGDYFSFALARYDDDGNPDNTFGTGGIVITKVEMTSAVTSIAIQTDGKIVVGGISSSNGINSDFTLARYNADGSLDNNFGSGGIVITASATSSDCINSIAIQPDGKIIAAGYSDYSGTNDFKLVRYNSNGDPDEMFGINGTVIIPLPGDEQAYSVALQNDRRIIVAGFLDYSGTRDFALVRCNEYGDLDATFGTDGLVTVDISGDDEIRGVMIQDNGEIIAAGKSFDEASGDGFFTLAGYDTSGNLNSNFGTGGIVVTEIGSFASAASIAIQSDGKIIAAGYADNGFNDDFALVRYNINGTLDSDFGEEGIVTTGSYADEFISSISILNDEKIIVAGFSDDGSDKRFALARYNTNGEEDNSFGENGRVVTQVGEAHNLVSSTVIQRDGKIIAAGTTFNGSDYDAALTRYKPDGELDSTFGINGVVTAGGIEDTYIYAVAIQTDPSGAEKIITGGYSDESGARDFILIRFNSDGTIDSTFGTNGIVVTSIWKANEIHSLAIQENGKIIAAGYADNGMNCGFAVARYNPDGELDTTFGGVGFATTLIGTISGFANSVVIESAGTEDGKIIVAGYCRQTGGEYDFALARFNINGDLDDDFGGIGFITTAIGVKDGHINSVAIQSDGKIIVAGYSSPEAGRDTLFTLARYNNNGTPDGSFGTYGLVTTKIGTSTKSMAVSLSIQSNGKIIAAGNCHQPGDPDDFAIARYNPDGELDDTFGTGGIVTTSIGAAYNYAYSSVIQSDGKIIVAGYSMNPDKNFSVFTLVRYEGDPATDIKEEIRDELPTSFMLEQNFPNPFNPITTIQFSIPGRQNVRLSVYNLLGQLVRTLVNEEMKAGWHSIVFNAAGFASGVYFYRMQTESFVSTKQFILLK